MVFTQGVAKLTDFDRLQVLRHIFFVGDAKALAWIVWPTGKVSHHTD